MTEDRAGWAVSEDMNGMKTGLILSVIWIFSVATAYPQGRVHFTNKRSDSIFGQSFDYKQWKPYLGILSTFEYTVELVHKSQVLGRATLNRYSAFDGGIIEVPGADSTVEEFRIRVFKSSDYNSWEHAVAEGKYYPPSALYLDFSVQTGPADHGGSGVVPTLTEAMAQAGEYENGIERDDIQLIGRRLGGAPTFLPKIDGATFDHIIGTRVKIEDRMYIISDEIKPSDYYEETSMTFTGSVYLGNFIELKEYRIFRIPGNLPFIVLEVDNEKGPVARDIYWSGHGHTSDEITFIHTTELSGHEFPGPLYGKIPAFYTLEVVPDQKAGELSLGVIHSDVTGFQLVFEEGIESGWIDVVYGNDVAQLRDAPASLAQFDGPLAGGKRIEIELPDLFETSEDGTIFFKAHHMVKATADISGPEIKVVNPVGGIVSGVPSIRVSGLATDRNYGDHGVEAVYVNGHPVEGAHADGDAEAVWFMDIDLEPGNNEILIRADDKSGNSSTVVIPVEYNPLVHAYPVTNEDFISQTVGAKMIWVNPGTFKMGAPEPFGNFLYREYPQQTVILTKGYWLGETEVTQDQWTVVMGNNPSRFRGSGQLPVEMVTRGKCMEFCDRLTNMERTAGRLPDNMRYSLPTEAQWEYASRAGTINYESDYPLEEKGWFDENSEFQFIGGNFNNGKTSGWIYEVYLDYKWSGTQVVAGKIPNPWGFFDMTGNVREWCLDRYGAYKGRPLIDPTGPAEGSEFVVRGGGWWTSRTFCRSSSRNSSGITYQANDIGFRIALQISE